MRKFFVLAITALAMLAGAGEANAQWGRPAPEDPTGLKDAYKDYFKVWLSTCATCATRTRSSSS